MRAIYLNINGPSGRLAAGTPIALLFYSDAAPPALHTGAVVEDGRLQVVLDGPDPADGTGVNVQVMAVPGCDTWPAPGQIKRGIIHGNEFIFDDGSLGIDMKAGNNNPFV